MVKTSPPAKRSKHSLNHQVQQCHTLGGLGELSCYPYGNFSGTSSQEKQAFITLSHQVQQCHTLGGLGELS
jgi:hypothetical protein